MRELYQSAGGGGGGGGGGDEDEDCEFHPASPLAKTRPLKHTQTHARPHVHRTSHARPPHLQTTSGTMSSKRGTWI